MSFSGEGIIYAAKEVDAPLVKIGFTRRIVRQRLQDLQEAFHTKLALVGEVYVEKYVWQVEHAVHTLLAPERIEREWFYVHMNQRVLEGLVFQAVERVAMVMGEQQCKYEQETLRREEKQKQVIINAENKKVRAKRIKHLGILLYRRIYDVDVEGKSLPEEILRSLAQALNVSADYLIGKNDGEWIPRKFEKYRPEGSPPC